VVTIDNDKQGVSTGRTQQRCAACKKFTRLAPRDKECASCAGRLDLPIPVKAGEAR
jgi:rRNA maturation endonuclease Nob1